MRIIDPASLYAGIFYEGIVRHMDVLPLAASQCKPMQANASQCKPLKYKGLLNKRKSQNSASILMARD